MEKENNVDCFVVGEYYKENNFDCIFRVNQIIEDKIIVKQTYRDSIIENHLSTKFFDLNNLTKASIKEISEFEVMEMKYRGAFVVYSGEQERRFLKKGMIFVVSSFNEKTNVLKCVCVNRPTENFPHYVSVNISDVSSLKFNYYDKKLDSSFNNFLKKYNLKIPMSTSCGYIVVKESAKNRLNLKTNILLKDSLYTLENGVVAEYDFVRRYPSRHKIKYNEIANIFNSNDFPRKSYFFLEYFIQHNINESTRLINNLSEGSFKQAVQREFNKFLGIVNEDKHYLMAE